MSPTAPNDDFGENSPRECRDQIPIWKKIVWATMTVVLIGLGLEAVLALAGFKPQVAGEDTFLVFTPHARLFEEQIAPDGEVILKTVENRLVRLNAQQFSKKKSPGTYRIFCVGGSTTYGAPYGDSTSFTRWLREFLPVVDGSRRFEVINAGALSYGSFRIALLMQELAGHEPDLFVVYMGHNEFLERQTYKKILETPEMVTSTVAILSRTRIFTALESLMKSESPTPDPPQTQPLHSSS